MSSTDYAKNLPNHWWQVNFQDRRANKQACLPWTYADFAYDFEFELLADVWAGVCLLLDQTCNQVHHNWSAREWLLPTAKLMHSTLMGPAGFSSLEKYSLLTALVEKTGGKRGPSAGSTLGWERRKGEKEKEESKIVWIRHAGVVPSNFFPVLHLPFIISTPWDCVAQAILWCVTNKKQKFNR